MVYKKQNYMTNVALKEQADKAQKDYVEPEEENDEEQNNDENTDENGD